MNQTLRHRRLCVRHMFPLLLAALLLVAVASTHAKGKRRAGSKPESAKEESSAPKIRVTVRQGSGNGNGQTQSLSGTPSGDTLVPIDSAGGFGASETDAAERAARQAEFERVRAAKAEAARDETLQADAARQALVRAAAEQAAAQARAEAAREEAEREKQRRAQAVLDEEVDRVLQRAMTYYPMLRTPAGEPVLQQIRERQQTLVARGMYPSVAMVEAVADHSHKLMQRTPDRPTAAAPVAAPTPSAVGGCHWATPIKWVCP